MQPTPRTRGDFSWLPLIVRRCGARERRQFRRIDARKRTKLGAQDGRDHDHAGCRAMGTMGRDGWARKAPMRSLLRSEFRWPPCNRMARLRSAGNPGNGTCNVRASMRGLIAEPAVEATKRTGLSGDTLSFLISSRLQWLPACLPSLFTMVHGSWMDGHGESSVTE